MKQRIRQLNTFTKREGFTIIELAIVLIVIGILFALGVGLLGPLTKRTKLEESREVVKQVREAVIGYVVKNGVLPNSLESAGARGFDAWGNNLEYYYFSVTGDICGTNNTGWSVRECTNDDCTSYNEKQNIVFIVYSGGFDGDKACTGTSSPFYVRKQNMGYNPPCTYTPSNPVFNYDDIVLYASLDEIRALRGCPQPLAITSPSTLPQGEEDSFYSFQLQAIGGKPPYTWTTWSGYGLTLDPSGLISGTVNYNTSSSTGELLNCTETINLSTQVSDSGGSTPLPYNGSITIRPKPLTIITQSLPSGIEGSPYLATIVASGGRTSYSWNMSVSPSCPGGLTCSGNSISGTPSAGTSGTYTVTSTVNDTCSTNTRNFVLTISPSGGGGGGCPLLSLNPPSGTIWSAIVGTPFNQSITVSGGVPPYTNTQCTPLSCNGLSLTCTPTGATISGTPTSTGTCNFNVAWQDSCTNPGPQTISGTYIVNISSSLPTCTLSASPGIVRYGETTTLQWTITNGPASGTFSPQSGTCTSFTNSNGGSCTTGGLTTQGANTFTLTLSPGGNTCQVTVYVGCQNYRVWNNTGFRRDFGIDGICKRVNNNSEITDPQYLNVGEYIEGFLTFDWSCAFPLGTLTYDQAMNADINGNRNCRVNFTGTDR